jgi:cytochrome c biogenesis protein CcmG/thiol:disulfide interchange protein DsbE
MPDRAMTGYRRFCRLAGGTCRFICGVCRLIAVAVLLLAVSGCGQPAARSGGPSSRVGRPAPDFGLPAVDGALIRLSDMQGEVVLVNFWGTYCPPCAEEMPDLQQLYERYRLAGFTVLGVDVEESPAAVRQFGADYGLTFPLLISDDASVNPTFGIRTLPTSWMVDRSGVVRHVWVGKVPIESAEEHLKALLAEPG